MRTHVRCSPFLTTSRRAASALRSAGEARRVVQPAGQQRAVEPTSDQSQGASGEAGSQQSGPGEGNDPDGQGRAQGMGRAAAAGWGLAARLPGRLVPGFTAASGQCAADTCTGLLGAPVKRRMRNRQHPTQGDGNDQQAEQHGIGLLDGHGGLGIHLAKIRGLTS
jgi:hypothetical protein